MKWAIAGAGAAAQVRLVDVDAGRGSAFSRSGSTVASGGSCATSVRTSLGMLRDQRQRVHGTTAAGEQVDRSGPERRDDPMDVVGVLVRALTRTSGSGFVLRSDPRGS